MQGAHVGRRSKGVGAVVACLLIAWACDDESGAAPEDAATVRAGTSGSSPTDASLASNAQTPGDASTLPDGAPSAQTPHTLVCWDRWYAATLDWDAAVAAHNGRPPPLCGPTECGVYLADSPHAEEECYLCVMVSCCREMGACSIVEAGPFVDRCYAPKLPCIQACFAREIAATALSSPDLVDACAAECGDLTEERADLLACIKRPSDDEDAGMFGHQSCSRACFPDWRE